MAKTRPLVTWNDPLNQRGRWVLNSREISQIGITITAPSRK